MLLNRPSAVTGPFSTKGVCWAPAADGSPLPDGASSAGFSDDPQPAIHVSPSPSQAINKQSRSIRSKLHAESAAFDR